MGYIDAIMEGGGTGASAYEITDLGMKEELVNIEIIRKDSDTLKRFLKSLPDSKSERELRLLCTRILQEEVRDEVADNEAQDAAHRSRDKQPVSKKQRDLGERLEKTPKAVTRRSRESF
jgi:hypothetical protein